MALAVLAGSLSARAEAPAPGAAASGSAEVSPVTVTAGARARPCPAGVEADPSGALACTAGRAAQSAQASAQQGPLRLAPSALSPTVSLGVVNTTALAEQFGANLGKSVTPARPTPPAQAPSPLSRAKP